MTQRVSDSQVSEDVEHMLVCKLYCGDKVMLDAGYPADLREARARIAALKAEIEGDKDKFAWLNTMLLRIGDAVGIDTISDDFPEKIKARIAELEAAAIRENNLRARLDAIHGHATEILREISKGGSPPAEPKQKPIVVLVIEGEGNFSLRHAGEVDVFCHDPSCKSEPIYQMLNQALADELRALVGDGPYPNANDERHPAIKAQVNEMLDGKPRLSLVTSELPRDEKSEEDTP